MSAQLLLLLLLGKKELKEHQVERNVSVHKKNTNTSSTSKFPKQRCATSRYKPFCFRPFPPSVLAVCGPAARWADLFRENFPQMANGEAYGLRADCRSKLKSTACTIKHSREREQQRKPREMSQIFASHEIRRCTILRQPKGHEPEAQQFTDHSSVSKLNHTTFDIF
ncbi:uncharacterized protein V6R79_020024 [Siganus canaliculatus]